MAMSQFRDMRKKMVRGDCETRLRHVGVWPIPVVMIGSNGWTRDLR